MSGSGEGPPTSSWPECNMGSSMPHAFPSCDHAPAQQLLQLPPASRLVLPARALVLPPTCLQPPPPHRLVAARHVNHHHRHRHAAVLRERRKYTSAPHGMQVGRAAGRKTHGVWGRMPWRKQPQVCTASTTAFLVCCMCMGDNRIAECFASQQSLSVAPVVACSSSLLTTPHLCCHFAGPVVQLPPREGAVQHHGQPQAQLASCHAEHDVVRQRVPVNAAGCRAGWCVSSKSCSSGSSSTVRLEHVPHVILVHEGPAEAPCQLLGEDRFAAAGEALGPRVIGAKAR